MNRILICGDRNWKDKEFIHHTLFPSPLWEKGFVECIIEGEAKGADKLAREIGEEYKIPVLKFPANWIEFGKSAGPIRNQQMLDEGKPDLVLAFHDNIESSKGTKDMISRATKAGIFTILYSHDNPQGKVV